MMTQMQNKLPPKPPINIEEGENKTQSLPSKPNINKNDIFDIDLNDIFDSKIEDINVSVSLIDGSAESGYDIYYINENDGINNDVDFEYIDYSD